MISEKFAQEQIRRLSGLSMYPPKDGRTELKRVIIRDCENEYHCRNAVDLALAESQFCPTPFTLAEFVGRSPSRMSDSGCAKCDGEGWFHVDNGGQGTMVCCSCELGRAKARAVRGEK